MTEQKRPQANEWWVNNSTRSVTRIIGVKLDRKIVSENRFGVTFSTSDWDDWIHEPRCTGFDWVQPPECTKWAIRKEATKSYYGKTIAYARLDKETDGEIFHTDGTSFSFRDNLQVEKYWRYCTEAEALRRLKPEMCTMCGADALPGTAGCQDCTEYAIEAVGAPVKSLVVTQIPVRLWCKKTTIGMHFSSTVYARRDFMGDDMAEIKHGPNGFYFEGDA